MSLFVPVPAPPVLPPVINLVTSSRNPLANGPQVDEDTGEPVRWENGYAFQAAINVDPTNKSMCSSNEDEGTGEPDTTTAPLVQTTPWFVETEEHCSVMGYRGRDYIGRAVTGLAAATPKGVEREFWTGALATADGAPNLFLANGGATDVTPTPGTAVSIEEAVERLEAALAGCGAGGRGMIHVAPIGTPPLTVVRRDGPLLLTPRDTIVVSGSGYPGTSPTGSAPAAGTTWLYATGLVEVRLGDIEVFGRVSGGQAWLGVGDGSQPQGFDPDKFTPALVDRTTNDLVVPARRVVAASWDGVCHFAVLASVPTGSI